MAQRHRNTSFCDKTIPMFTKKFEWVRTILFLSRAWQRTSRDRWSHVLEQPIRARLEFLKDGRSREVSGGVTSSVAQQRSGANACLSSSHQSHTITLTSGQCVHYSDGMINEAAIHKKIKVQSEYKPYSDLFIQDTTHLNHGFIVIKNVLQWLKSQTTTFPPQKHSSLRSS